MTRLDRCASRTCATTPRRRGHFCSRALRPMRSMPHSTRRWPPRSSTTAVRRGEPRRSEFRKVEHPRTRWLTLGKRYREMAEIESRETNHELARPFGPPDGARAHLDDIQRDFVDVGGMGFPEDLAVSPGDRA